MMNTKEKMAYLNALTEEEFPYVYETIGDGIIERDKKNPSRLAVRFDLRHYIRKRLEEEGTSLYALSNRVGKIQQNMTAYMTGRAPIPLNTIEEILWLILPQEILDYNKED